MKYNEFMIILDVIFLMDFVSDVEGDWEGIGI
jgi:hypothetical protein